MKKLLGYTTLVLMVLVVMAAPALLADGGKADAGKVVFDKRCASCHGKMGEGNPAIAKAMKVEFQALGSKEVQAKSDDELRKIITEGTDKKKPVKGLSEEDLANVIAYLRTLAKK